MSFPEIKLRVERNQFYQDWGHDTRAEVGIMLMRTINKMADDMQDAAIAFAPQGETGALRTSLVGGKDKAEPYGANKYRAYVRLPKEPKHNLWVHEGTGIFGPRHSPIRSPRGNIMHFFHVGQWWSLKTVKGQTPQPFMKEAYEAVADTKVPARVRTLAYELRTKKAIG